MPERVRQISSLDPAISPDVELGEEPLVHHAAHGRPCNLVVAGAVASDCQCTFKPLFEIGDGRLRRFQRLFSCGDFSHEPVHLRLQHVERNGTGIVRSKHLLPLAAGIQESLLGLLRIEISSLAFRGQLIMDCAPNLAYSNRLQLEGVVERFHTSFDSFDLHGPPHARRSLEPPAHAEEVVICAAATLVAAKNETVPASTTKDAAFEVLGVLPVFVARRVMGVQDKARMTR